VIVGVLIVGLVMVLLVRVSVLDIVGIATPSMLSMPPEPVSVLAEAWDSSMPPVAVVVPVTVRLSATVVSLVEWPMVTAMPDVSVASLSTRGVGDVAIGPIMVDGEIVTIA